MTDQGSSSFEIETIFARLVERARELVAFDSGGIILFDPEQYSLEAYAYYNLPPERPMFIFGEELAGITAQSGRARLENDLASYPTLCHMPKAGSALAVPIVLDDDLIGVFLAECERPNAYETRDLKILQSLAEQAALAAQMTGLYEMLSARYDDLSAANEALSLRNDVSRLAASDEPLETLLPKMAVYITQISRADACAITLWDETERRPRRVAAHGLNLIDFFSANLRRHDLPSLTESIVNTGQIFIINQVQELSQTPSSLIADFAPQALLGMPLSARGKPMGAVFLLSFDPEFEFASEHADQISAILDQMGMTIENRMLLQDTQTRLAEATLLLEAAAASSTSLQPDDILERCLVLTRDFLGVGFGMFLLHDRDNNVLEVRTDKYFGLPETIVGIRIKVNAPGDQIAIVFTSGASFFANHLRQTVPEHLLNYKDIFERAGLKNIMIVPLRVQDTPMGVFVVGNKPEEFTRADAELLMAMGSHVAAALRSLELLDNAEKRLREKSALQRVAEITSSTLDLDDMLERAVRQATDVLEADGALLLLPDAGRRALVPHPRACFGVAAQLPLAALGSLELNGSSALAKAFKSGTPQAGERQIIAEKPYQYALFPLKRRDISLGVVTLFVAEGSPRAIDDVASDMMRAIASQIATSMENLQLFAAERKRADMAALVNQIGQELTATLNLNDLTPKATRAVQANFGYETVALILIDETISQAVVRSAVSSLPDVRLSEGFAFDLNAGILRRALMEAETVSIPDLLQNPPPAGGLPLPARGSLVALPLRYGPRILGALLAATERPNGFDRMDVLVLQNYAAQLSVTVENARLWDQVRRRLIEQSIVHQIGQDLASILKYDDLVNAIVKHMNRALDTAVCMLALWQAESGQISVEAEYRVLEGQENTFPPFAHRPLDIEARDIIGQAIHSRRFMLITPERADPSTRRYMERRGFSILMLVPLVVGERVLGCMVWLETRGARTLSDEDVRLAQTLATQAAIAMDNAMLVETLEDRAEELVRLNRLKSEFLASISHELRTPMNSINGYSEMLLKGIYGALSEKQVDRVERILRNGRNLLALIDDLLDISKIDAGRMELKLEALSLYDELGASIYNLESQAAGRGLYLTLEAPDEKMPRVLADPMRLRQIITNLLSNALKFTKQGGIRVKILVAQENGQTQLWTSVSDTGIGIRKEDQAVIFDEFRQADGSATREFGGTGLGLAITKRLVEMMGGRIWVDSDTGRGSTFTFSLPTTSASSMPVGG